MVDEPVKPVEADVRFEDQDYNPAMEPKKAKAWLNLLLESEDAFEDWNNHCDKIDRQYASLQRLSGMTRDKEFQMFWANCEVLKPSIYAKPPIPVVVPKFKDRRPVYQAASEVMERCCVVAFDLTRINDLMLLVRDDLSMTSRGAAWCRYESGKGDGTYDHEKVCIDFKGRRDFLHSISRNWREVSWVAAASYLTRGEARKRFRKHSGDAYQEAEYKVDRESAEVGGADNRERAKFWEIWHKGSKRVLWVSHGCEDILDEDDPHLELQNFFPCPPPAYGTVQRGSLIPVPDVMQYRDQLEEINLLTGRIHALSDAIEAKGFYPAGGGEMATAIETAVKTHTSSRMLIPISNWAAFGGTKDVIIWLPIDMIATTITALVALRKQVIEDIYQIMGLSDIMRGATDPNETLGAQQLKTQYGSTRIRDKQQEMVRLARDLVEITSEIITEKFDDVTIIEMSQTQLPTREMQAQKMAQIQQALAQGQQMAQQAPQGQPQDPAQGQQMQQMMQQGQAKLQKMAEEPTIEQVLQFLSNNRAKSFVLDIETDSTIMADENAEKQRRTEFVGVLGQLLPQLSTMIQNEPKTAPFCGEILKFATAPFRSGRSLDGAIDELIEQMKAKSDQPQGDDPVTAKAKQDMQIEQLKQKTIADRDAMDAKLKASELLQKDQHKRMELENERVIAQAQMQDKARDAEGKMQVQNQKMMENREAHQAHMLENQQKLDLDRQKAGMAMQQHQNKQQDMASRANERQMAAAQKRNNGIGGLG
jgi:hypothetical protein